MFMTIGEVISNGLKIEQPDFEQDAPMTWHDDSSYMDSPVRRGLLTQRTTNGIIPLDRSSPLSSTRG